MELKDESGVGHLSGARVERAWAIYLELGGGVRLNYLSGVRVKKVWATYGELGVEKAWAIYGELEVEKVGHMLGEAWSRWQPTHVELSHMEAWVKNEKK